MPVKKAGGKKGTKGKKGKKSKETGPVLPETGPLFAEGPVDPMKGGKIKATRLGRTYELSVPPGAVSETCVIALRVRDFDGNTPQDFRFDGRIVSNKIEVSTEPRSLEFDIPAILRVPHFCADTDGESEMFVACLEAQDTRIVADMSEDGDESGMQKEVEDDQTWKKLPGGSFNVGIGFAAVETSRLGIFYVCSNIADGVDSAVTTYDMKLPPGAEFNAVAFDWVPGSVNLWTRTSLDRPVGPDGPVYLRRKRRVKVDFEAKRIKNKGLIDGFPTYEATFSIPDSRIDLYTGLPIHNKDQGKEGDEQANEGAFDALLYEVMVVPEQSAKLVDGAQEKLDQAIQDEKVAERHAIASGRHLDLSERKLYWDRIVAAKAVLKEMQDMYLPWSERRKAALAQPAAPAKLPELPAELTAKPESEIAPPDAEQAEGKAGQDDEQPSESPRSEQPPESPKSAAPPDPSPLPVAKGPSIAVFDAAAQKEPGAATQQYKDLPVWNGANRVVRFGLRMIPSSGFHEQHLMTEMSVLMADPSGAEQRLLEIPEPPGLGGKVRKVWAGPPKEKVHTFTPVLTRASFAELIVRVQLGVWGKKIVITISSGSYTLGDVREIVATHCFGRDLSEARFVMPDGSHLDVGREGSVRAQTLRPSVGLWGNARRKGIYDKSVMLSYTPECKELVSQIYDNLKMRGFPVWMDREYGGAKGAEGLGSAGLFVAFLTAKYQSDARAAEEYAEADAKGLAKLHLWPTSFVPHGWLKAALKEPEKYATHDLPEGLCALTAQQLDHVAIAVFKQYPAAAPPVIFYKRLPAPNAAAPPVSPVEWLRLNPPPVIMPEPVKSPKKEKKKKSASSPGGKAGAKASPTKKKK